MLASLLAVGFVLLASCSTQPTATPTPVPSPTLAPTATPIATPTPVPSPTLTPTATPEPTPEPTATPTPSLADDFTEFFDESGLRESDIVDAVERLFREFMDAALADPPDLEAANATYAEACKIPHDELAAAIEQLRALFQDAEVGLEIMAASRLSDSVGIVLSYMTLDGVPLSGATRSIVVFENGRWLDSDCEAGRALVLGQDPAEETEEPSGTDFTMGFWEGDSDDQRVAYIGEPVLVWFDEDGQPYNLTVLGAPEPASPTELRLPVRVTAVTDILNFDSVSHFVYLETEPDANGDTIEWWGEECEASPTGLTLARGGYLDQHLCFTSDYLGEVSGVPIPDEPFARLVAFYGEDTIRAVELDVSRAVDAETPTFQPGDVWGEEPVARIGETVTASDCWYGPYMELTVLQSAELLTETTARVRVRITSLGAEPLRLSYHFELAAGPERDGRIHRWTLLEAADSLMDATLMEGESAEGFLHFEAPVRSGTRSQPPPSALLYWSACWQKPVHLSLPEGER